MSESRTDIVSVYATFAGDEEARRIARQLVEERLAACANILGPCHSIYRWQGAIEEAAEVAGDLQDARRRARRARRADRRAAQLRRAGGRGLADRARAAGLCESGFNGGGDRLALFR